MTANMKKWLELVSENKELQRQLAERSKEAPEQQKAYTISMAGKNGIILTEEDFTSAESEELSDEELDAVAGAGSKFCSGGGHTYLLCRCPENGAGYAQNTTGMFSTACFCTAAGNGKFDDVEWHHKGSGGGTCNNPNKDYCMCPFAGGGTDNGLSGK